LAGLRVNPTIELDGQTVFEAVEIHNPVPDVTLATKFRAQLPAPQQVPR